MSEEVWENASLLFLSCDLTGSTNFKQRRDLVEPWQKVFLQFYREFPQRVAMTQVALGTTNLDFRLWKPVGDELYYLCRVRSEEDVYNAVRTWLKAMRDYETQSLDDTSMGTKGGAFIATFPGPDSRASVPRRPGTEVSDADVILLNEAALRTRDNDAFVYDYFGPSIDTGFRVVSKCDPRFFTLSVEVALAMLGRPVSPGTEPEDLLLLDFVELKGVWKNQRYPIVAIDRDHEDPVNRAYTKFETRGSIEELQSLCKACYRSEGWPSRLFLPEAKIEEYREPPKSALADYVPTTSTGSEEIVDDEPPDAQGDLGEDVDLGLPRKAEVVVGFVYGDDRLHGYVPDGSVLCEAVGEDQSDPYLPPDRCNMPDDGLCDFDPADLASCTECALIYADLPE